MPRPAHRLQSVSEPPPTTVELRYRYHRGRRNARILQREENRLARYRFYIVLTVLLAISGVFVVAAWREINTLFGL